MSLIESYEKEVPGYHSEFEDLVEKFVASHTSQYLAGFETAWYPGEYLQLCFKREADKVRVTANFKINGDTLYFPSIAATLKSDFWKK